MANKSPKEFFSEQPSQNNNLSSFDCANKSPKIEQKSIDFQELCNGLITKSEKSISTNKELYLDLFEHCKIYDDEFQKPSSENMCELSGLHRNVLTSISDYMSQVDDFIDTKLENFDNLHTACLLDKIENFKAPRKKYKVSLCKNIIDSDRKSAQKYIDNYYRKFDSSKWKNKKLVVHIEKNLLPNTRMYYDYFKSNKISLVILTRIQFNFK